MAFLQCSDLLIYKNKKKPIMGIDYGDKRIGLSISDLTWTIATPYKTIFVVSKKKAIYEICSIIKEKEVIACVVGYPLTLKGSEGIQVKKVHLFIEELLKVYDIPIVLWDERLSSKSAEYILKDVKLTNSKKKEAVNKIAASIILQNALDSLMFIKSFA
ncbi:MAG: Holliday junction resolvase RuvX [Alphaproteobacteria bacterium]